MTSMVGKVKEVAVEDWIVSVRTRGTPLLVLFINRAYLLSLSGSESMVWYSFSPVFSPPLFLLTPLCVIGSY